MQFVALPPRVADEEHRASVRIDQLRADPRAFIRLIVTLAARVALQNECAIVAPDQSRTEAIDVTMRRRDFGCVRRAGRCIGGREAARSQ
jgi:hypothetical protein